MSGHSKWSTIKRQKESADQQRGRLFSKLSRAIFLAAKQNGSDPNQNLKLRLAIDQAKAANMPKKNVERILEKVQGDQEGINWQEAVYEGFGPAGVAVMIVTATDNKNRTAAEIKKILERAGGSLAQPGAVSFLFKTSGLISVAKKKTADEQILQLIDLGAEDVWESKEAVKVAIAPQNLEATKQKISQAGFVVLAAELIKKPISLVAVSESATQAKIKEFLKILEAHDDVQQIWTNANLDQN